MGAVYLATHTSVGRKFAIKEMEMRGLSPRDLQSAVEQFRSEATLLANLEHPNLVSVSDFFTEGDRHYLVMAYVPGQTLQQRLRARGKPIPWTQVKEWARPLCEVLSYLHNQNPPILFRDLKPSNIMVEESGRLRLIDFGIARKDEGEKTKSFLKGTGTSGFSPLEQYGGSETTDQRSDIYALGATLYQLLTGKVPADAVSRVSQGAKVASPSSIVPELPRALDRVILKALAMNKADRYQTVAEMLADLEAVGLSKQDAEDTTEDLKMEAARAAATPSQPAERPAPNITVEFIPSKPGYSRLQVALGLGSAAAVTLLLSSALLRPGAPETARDHVTPTPLAVVRTTEPAPRRPLAETAPEEQSSTRTAATPGLPRPDAAERPAQPVTAADPAEPKARPAKRRRVIQAVANQPSTVPTAPRVNREEEPSATDPRPDPVAPPPSPRPVGFEPPPVPEGMPTPLRGPDGKYLPPHMQPPGFPGAPRYGREQTGPAEPGTRDGIPGYDTRRRRREQVKDLRSP
jgi:serine/threonine-protein kinase